MAGPMPGLLTLMEELYGRINKERLFGGGVRGAATRGLLGAQPAENMTPTQRDVYENAVRISAPAQGLTALKAATVFHGSPAKFKRFDPTKIGTGEGAQAFGHGLYFTESPDVASTYASMRSPMPRLYKNGEPFEAKTHAEMLAEARALGAKSLDEAIEKQTRKLQANKKNENGMALLEETGRSVDEERRILSALRNIKSQGYQPGFGGSLYTVDLPDEQIAKMLDWDKPLSQQPEAVRVAAMDLGLPKTATGKDIYNAFSNSARDAAIARGNKAGTTLSASQASASADLRGFGIPGIRYLDQGSRGAGQGTSNFVIFPGEEELLRILERNGVPITSLLD